MATGRHERRFSAMKIDLQIGRYRIRLQEREDYRCFFWPIRPFVPFLVRSNEPPDLDFKVTVTKHLPDLPRGRLIFDASHGLWKLYEAESGCLFESPDTHTLEPHIRALISRDFSRIEAWVRPHHARRKHRVGWEPTTIINPLVEVSLFVLRQCFLPHWDHEAMGRTLAFLDDLIERIGCFELAFAKNPDIVDYLEEQRLGRTLVPS